ncbi:hypothetical protein E2C01_025970 [Portunus trituberculatus]|uniref:Uncharacterized protein n=1 Tax=Portunus trituberculatus TaxID=210409 RepID=A0A5B7EGV9_PORTR|nr:hypothetical protein [Portunus trituberculatus]
MFGEEAAARLPGSPAPHPPSRPAPCSPAAPQLARRAARRSIPAPGSVHGSAKPLARVTLAKVSREEHAD